MLKTSSRVLGLVFIAFGGILKNAIIVKVVNRFNKVLRILVIPSLLLLMIGLYRIDKYLNWHLFALFLIIVGFIVSFLIINFIKKRFLGKLNKKEFKEYNKQHFSFKVYLLTVFVCFGGGVLIGESAVSLKQTKSFEIVNKGESGRIKHRQYYLFINNEGKVERFSFGKNVYDKHQIGDLINLSIKSNIFGFEFLEPEEWNK